MSHDLADHPLPLALQLQRLFQEAGGLFTGHNLAQGRPGLHLGIEYLGGHFRRQLGNPCVQFHIHHNTLNHAHHLLFRSDAVQGYLTGITPELIQFLLQKPVQPGAL